MNWGLIMIYTFYVFISWIYCILNIVYFVVLVAYILEIVTMTHGWYSVLLWQPADVNLYMRQVFYQFYVYLLLFISV